MTRRIPFAAALLAASLSVAVLGGCVSAPPPDVYYVATAPPAPEVEVVGVAPGPDFIWVRGYHTWNGRNYVWHHGEWQRRPHTGATWVDGRWRHHSRGWYWTPGHWK